MDYSILEYAKSLLFPIGRWIYKGLELACHFRVIFVQGLDEEQLILSFVIHDAIQLTPYHYVHVFCDAPFPIPAHHSLTILSGLSMTVDAMNTN